MANVLSPPSLDDGDWDDLLSPRNETGDRNTTTTPTTTLAQVSPHADSSNASLTSSFSNAGASSPQTHDASRFSSFQQTPLPSSPFSHPPPSSSAPAPPSSSSPSLSVSPSLRADGGNAREDYGDLKTKQHQADKRVLSSSSSWSSSAVSIGERNDRIASNAEDGDDKDANADSREDANPPSSSSSNNIGTFSKVINFITGGSSSTPTTTTMQEKARSSSSSSLSSSGSWSRASVFSKSFFDSLIANRSNTASISLLGSAMSLHQVPALHSFSSSPPVMEDVVYDPPEFAPGGFSHVTLLLFVPFTSSPDPVFFLIAKDVSKDPIPMHPVGNNFWCVTVAVVTKKGRFWSGDQKELDYKYMYRTTKKSKFEERNSRKFNSLDKSLQIDGWSQSSHSDKNLRRVQSNFTLDYLNVLWDRLSRDFLEKHSMKLWIKEIIANFSLTFVANEKTVNEVLAWSNSIVQSKTIQASGQRLHPLLALALLVVRGLLLSKYNGYVASSETERLLSFSLVDPCLYDGSFYLHNYISDNGFNYIAIALKSLMNQTSLDWFLLSPLFDVINSVSPQTKISYQSLPALTKIHPQFFQDWFKEAVANDCLFLTPSTNPQSLPVARLILQCAPDIDSFLIVSDHIIKEPRLQNLEEVFIKQLSHRAGSFSWKRPTLARDQEIWGFAFNSEKKGSILDQQFVSIFKMLTDSCTNGFFTIVDFVPLLSILLEASSLNPSPKYHSDMKKIASSTIKKALPAPLETRSKFLVALYNVIVLHCSSHVVNNTPHYLRSWKVLTTFQ